MEVTQIGKSEDSGLLASTSNVKKMCDKKLQMVQVKRREATLNGWNRGHYSDRLEGISLFHFSSSALIHFHRNDQGPTSHTVSSDKTSFNRPQRKNSFPIYMLPLDVDNTSSPRVGDFSLFTQVSHLHQGRAELRR